jgi:signal transduction histidine kinase
MLLDTVDELTSNIKETVWSLKLKEERVSVYFLFIQKYLQDYLRPTSIQLEVDKQVENDRILSAKMMREVFMCIKELSYNSVKYAEATKLTITLKAGKDLAISIIDNGKGFNSDALPGNGLKSITTRMQNLGGAFVYDSTQKGTANSLRIFW